MIAPIGRFPLDYVRHFAPAPNLRPPRRRRFAAAAGRGPGPAECPSVPAAGEPSGNGRTVPPIPANAWHRTGHGAGSADSLEHAMLPGGGAALRLSRQPDVVLTYTKGEWEAFVAGAGEGEFTPAALVGAADQPSEVAP
jgi:hypothetical protein